MCHNKISYLAAEQFFLQSEHLLKAIVRSAEAMKTNAASISAAREAVIRTELKHLRDILPRGKNDQYVRGLLLLGEKRDYTDKEQSSVKKAYLDYIECLKSRVMDEAEKKLGQRTIEKLMAAPHLRFMIMDMSTATAHPTFMQALNPAAGRTDDDEDDPETDALLEGNEGIDIAPATSEDLSFHSIATGSTGSGSYLEVGDGERKKRKYDDEEEDDEEEKEEEPVKRARGDDVVSEEDSDSPSFKAFESPSARQGFQLLLSPKRSLVYGKHKAALKAADAQNKKSAINHRKPIHISDTTISMVTQMEIGSSIITLFSGAELGALVKAGTLFSALSKGILDATKKTDNNTLNAAQSSSGFTQDFVDSVFRSHGTLKKK